MSSSVLSSDDPASTVEPSHLDFPVVGVGASAGCIAALLKLFEPMPVQPGMAFVIVVHLSPEHASSIDSILAKVTPMPVLQVRESVAIEVDHVYVISPTLQLAMSDGHLHVTELKRPPGQHVAIDIFFRTLAEAHSDRSFCVVLSGTGSDGSVGLRRIKELGGVTLVQTPSDAEFDGMPSSAIATGAVDFVLPAAEMGAKLIDLWKNIQHIELPDPAASELKVDAPPTADAIARAEQALAEVMTLLRNRTGHDFKHYKRATVLRRIERRLQVNAVPNLPDYRDLLQARPEETAALLKDLLISVTNFFRDQEAFESLGKALDPTLFPPLGAYRKLRTWVAGCATGEEAYSVAMLLTERAALQRHEPDIQVFASDIDERAIAIARTGLYPDTILTDVSPARLRRFFEKEGNQVRVRKELREKVLFAAHNILRDPPFSNLDLVCCRNLLIYLDREVQAKVLHVIHFALRPGGLLFLGSSESVDVAGDLFETVDKKHRIYRASTLRPDQRPLPVLPSLARLRPLASIVPAAHAHSGAAEAHDRARLAHTPPSVLIDETYSILHSTSRASAFLRFAPGQPSRNLLEVVRPELRLPLRTALFRAWKEKKSVEARRVSVEEHGQSVWITLTARPIDDAERPLMLVLFDQVEATLGPDVEAGAPTDPMLEVLEDELQRTREQLQNSIGDSAASTEELRASNEELQAINEELRSATEELETSQEELQSVNEELITVNQELKDKIDEIGKANDDLKNLIASTGIATVFVDRSMRIKRFTPRASQLFNLIGTDVGRSLLDITHRLDYPLLERDAVEAFESLRVIEREVRGDDDRTFLVRVLPYRTHEDVIDGAVLSFIDITATRRAEDRVEAGEAKLRMVVESTQDYAIITTDVDGLVTAWNHGAQRMFGFTEAEIVGRSLDIIFTPEDRAAGVPQAERRCARVEGRAPDERWHVAKDGHLLYCSGITTPLFEKDQSIGFAKIARDLSDSKRAEGQLQALLVQEKEIRAELQRAIMLKDEFLAVMSHELKQPLNLIHVNAELLSRLPDARESASVTRAAEVIRRAVMSQAKIIDDLLDLSRLRTGKLTLTTMPVQWDGVVARVLGAVADDARSLRLGLESDLDAAPISVQADPVRLEQIVWNLVSNALKFTPPGGSVRVRLSVDGGFGRLDVSDTGRGISADFLEHVFDMFRQADRSTTRAQGGMGIGLALVRHLAEEHGGRVAAASAGPDKGASFSVWLPLSATQSTDRVSPARLPALSNLHILVVDDTADALESFALLLRLEGAEVTAVGSGQEALEAAAAHDFDLVLSDVAMPGMDGYELIGRLRADERTAGIPAVALTGFGRSQDAKRALGAGFDAHLPKPVEIDELLQTIKRLPTFESRRAVRS